MEGKLGCSKQATRGSSPLLQYTGKLPHVTLVIEKWWLCYHHVFVVFALKVEACFELKHSCFSEMHGVSTVVNSIPICTQFPAQTWACRDRDWASGVLWAPASECRWSLAALDLSALGSRMFPGHGGLAALGRGVLSDMAERPLLEIICAPFWKEDASFLGGRREWYPTTPVDRGKEILLILTCAFFLHSQDPCLSISTSKNSERRCALQDGGEAILLLNIHSMAGPRSLSQTRDFLRC